MSKVLPFSTTFPGYHPKAGQPTYFVEKIWNSIYPKGFDFYFHFDDTFNKLNKHLPQEVQGAFISKLNSAIEDSKHHTIRSGHRWKVGDKFSPRIWSGKPYHSKQIIIAPDIEVKKVWDIEIERHPLNKHLLRVYINGVMLPDVKQYSDLAINDGLEHDDFYNWFNKSFKGQIICWNENINY